MKTLKFAKWPITISLVVFFFGDLKKAQHATCCWPSKEKIKMLLEMVEQNGEARRTYVKQEGVNYGYDTSYMNYSTPTPTPTQVNQPLPGQPPLPPMPPPSTTVPPPPSVFNPVPSQVAQITWAHAPTPWQWITPQTSAIAPQVPQVSREVMANVFQRDMPLRNNYPRRERFNNNRNHVYSQRGNFHRKNRKRFDQTQNQYDQTQYYGTPLCGNLGLDWQRNNFVGVTNEALMNHMGVSLPNHQLAHIAQGVKAVLQNGNELNDQDVNISVEKVVLKKNKPRKPMSQSYPSRPWNREDAERALQTENECKNSKAQGLIIKFPDPDLNKDIVRKFHSEIQNIHFQNPSAPRYCFIQMSQSVDIEEAMKELEKIPFGTGYLKVERKLLHAKDNPSPEEIDPYTLYIGNLPESVNVNEVKSKFPTAARVDIGYAQRVRNTRYAFIRYNTVDDSIAAYKKALDLMWDTRNNIVRFRRHLGNTCLPGEPKGNQKKKKDIKNAAESAEVKEESVKNEKSLGESSTTVQVTTDVDTIPETTVENKQNNQTKEPKSNSDQLAMLSVPPPPPPKEGASDFYMLDIKEEPEDYNEMDMQDYDADGDDDEMVMDDMQDDDDGDDEEVDDEDDEEDLDDAIDDGSEEEENVDFASWKISLEKKSKADDIPPDGLDKMFNALDNVAKDISL